jgi:diadenosine tetraphosphatase ApaH/serine/threonine PP2A family protein phosphatase
MKYGILGDIHANLDALEKALAAFEAARVQRIVSVGDVVGYGAAPRECIARLREIGASVVKGNHDAACVGELDLAGFNPYARQAVLWTRSQLSPEEQRWLADLPLIEHTDDCMVAHGSPYEPWRFDYVQTVLDADRSLDTMEQAICFVGHTHVPVILLRLHDDPLRTGYTLDTEVDLSEARCALVNVGSVGQPRDEDPRAAYVIFDSESSVVSLRRVAYDIELEARRIRAAGLPDVLAERLFLGV